MTYCMCCKIKVSCSRTCSTKEGAFHLHQFQKSVILIQKCRIERMSFSSSLTTLSFELPKFTFPCKVLVVKVLCCHFKFALKLDFVEWSQSFRITLKTAVNTQNNVTSVEKRTYQEIRQVFGSSLYLCKC